MRVARQREDRTEGDEWKTEQAAPERHVELREQLGRGDTGGDQRERGAVPREERALVGVAEADVDLLLEAPGVRSVRGVRHRPLAVSTAVRLPTLPPSVAFGSLREPNATHAGDGPGLPELVGVGVGAGDRAEERRREHDRAEAGGREVVAEARRSCSSQISTGSPSTKYRWQKRSAASSRGTSDGALPSSGIGVKVTTWSAAAAAGTHPLGDLGVLDAVRQLADDEHEPGVAAVERELGRHAVGVGVDLAAVLVHERVDVVAVREHAAVLRAAS